MIDFLLSLPTININAKDSYGRTPLQLVQLLIQLCTTCRISSNDTILHFRRQYDIIARELVLHGGTSTLELSGDATSTNNTNGSSTTGAFTPNVSLLHFAVAIRETSLIKSILDNNLMDVNLINALEHTPLYFAVRTGYSEGTMLLLKHKKINVNLPIKFDKTALHIAVQEGHAECVEALLYHNDIDVNATDSCNKTPLHIACQKGHTEIVKLLLMHKSINPSIKSNEPGHVGQTAWDYAGENNHTECMKVLLRYHRINGSINPNNALSHGVY